MKFATIFMGRMSPAELYEFSEKLLQITIAYAMSYRERKPAEYAEESTTDNEPMSLSDIRFSNEMTLQERMFGVYLTYALYFVQPESYVAQVRVTPDQMADLIDFISERLIPERHIDAFAALFKLINGGAFRIYAFEKEHNPLLHRRFDLRELDEGVWMKRKHRSTHFKKYGSRNEVNLSPKKAPRQNSGRFRSALKEKAYKSHIIHARHRRYLVDPSVSSTNSETEQERNMISATELEESSRGMLDAENTETLFIKWIRQRYGGEDMGDVLLLSEEKRRNESESSTGATGSSKKLGKSSKVTKKKTGGRKRGRSKLSISEMSLAELTHDLGESVAALNQEEREIENSKKERIADRLLEKIQKAQEKNV
uniref:PAP-associated domain-containing protein n=1 Tax=Loa loa TaxID=7209 RepID=A0A1I7W4C6_LOALO